MSTPEAVFLRTTNASELAFGRESPLADGGRFMRHEMLLVPGRGSAGDTAGVALPVGSVSLRVTVSPVLKAGAISGIAFLSPANAVAATTYAVVLTSGTYSATGSTDPKTLLDEIAADIVAGAGTDPEDDKVVVVPWGEENGFAAGTYAIIVWNEGNLAGGTPAGATPIAPALSFNVTDTSSTGVWTAAYMDSTDVDFKIWQMHVADSETANVDEPWSVPNNLAVTGQEDPWTERINLAGSSRVAVQITACTATAGMGAAVTKTAWAWISPAIQETT